TLDANITDPNGQLLASYNLSNVSLGTDEQFTETIDIPGDAMTGDYQIEMFVEDVYRGNKTVLRSFSVRENTQTFELSDTTLEPEFNRKGQYETELNITDISGTGLNISMAKSNGLEGALNFTEDFQVDPDEMKSLTLEWNISDLQSYSGEIEVVDEDSNYNTTVDVDTDAPDCEMQDGNLCSPSSNSVTETMDERTTRETTVEVINIGEQGSTRTVSMSVSGNISDYVSVPEEESFSDTYEIPVNFTPQERGMFTGTMTAASENSELQYDLELNSNVPSGTPNVDVTETVNIGPLVEGESEDAEVAIDNTGEIKVGNISLSSETYSVDADTDGMEIPGESSDTISVTFNDVSSSSGQLEISLEALEQANETVDVSAEVYSDYSSKIDDLFSDIQNLRDSTGNQQALSTLDEAETTLDSAEVSWENGNYEDAINTYEDADEKYQ
ncbi:MAG: hypothetical protein BRC30_00610, partial [Nanohaloarchaea archaeon SW_7_46_7]